MYDDIVYMPTNGQLSDTMKAAHESALYEEQQKVMGKIDRKFTLGYHHDEAVFDRNEHTLKETARLYGEAGSSTVEKIFLMPDFTVEPLTHDKDTVKGMATFISIYSSIDPGLPVNGIKSMGDGVTLVKLDPTKFTGGIKDISGYKKFVGDVVKGNGTDRYKFHDISPLDQQDIKKYHEEQQSILSKSSSQKFDKNELSKLATLSGNFRFSLVQKPRTDDSKQTDYYIAVEGASLYDAKVFNAIANQQGKAKKYDTFSELAKSPEYKNTQAHSEVARLLAASLFSDYLADKTTVTKKFHGKDLVLPAATVNMSRNSIQLFEDQETKHSMGINDSFYGVFAGVLCPSSSQGGVLFSKAPNKGYLWYHTLSDKNKIPNGWKDNTYPFFPSGALDKSDSMGIDAFFLNDKEQKFVKTRVVSRGEIVQKNYSTKNFIYPKSNTVDKYANDYKTRIEMLKQSGIVCKKLSPLAIYDHTDNKEFASEEQLHAMINRGDAHIQIPITNTNITNKILSVLHEKTLDASQGKSAFAPKIGTIITHNPDNSHYLCVNSKALKSILLGKPLPAETGDSGASIETLLKTHPLDKV